VSHGLPGRTRFRIPEKKGYLSFYTEVETILTNLPGIARVQANHLTGSVLVFHSPDTNLSQIKQHAENSGLFRFDNPGKKNQFYLTPGINQRTQHKLRLNKF
jgi:hypothetical protein